MKSMGIRKSPSGLELTIAVPGHGLNSSFGSDGGNGCNNGNARELALLDTNHPASGGEELQVGSVEIMEDEEERGAGAGVSQRSKKPRLSDEQYQLLEENFRLNHTIEPIQRDALAERLKLRTRQVEVWFQNRRARLKLKNTGMECDYLRQCFGTLTQENRRLQREVEELRATMRVAPPAAALAMPLSAPAFAVVCPHCERVVAPAAAAQQAAGTWAATTSLPLSSSSSYPLQLCGPSLAL